MHQSRSGVSSSRRRNISFKYCKIIVNCHARKNGHNTCERIIRGWYDAAFCLDNKTTHQCKVLRFRQLRLQSEGFTTARNYKYHIRVIFLTNTKCLLMMPGLKVCLCFISLPNFGLVSVVADLEQLYPATFVVNSPLECYPCMWCIQD